MKLNLFSHRRFAVKAALNIKVGNFIQALHVFGGVSVRQKHEFLYYKWIRCISRVFQGYFCCMRGPSFVELTGHDNSATLAVTVQI